MFKTGRRERKKKITEQSVIVTYLVWYNFCLKRHFCASLGEITSQVIISPKKRKTFKKLALNLTVCVDILIAVLYFPGAVIRISQPQHMNPNSSLETS